MSVCRRGNDVKTGWLSTTLNSQVHGPYACPFHHTTTYPVVPKQAAKKTLLIVPYTQVGESTPFIYEYEYVRTYASSGETTKSTQIDSSYEGVECI